VEKANVPIILIIIRPPPIRNTITQHHQRPRTHGHIPPHRTNKIPMHTPRTLPLEIHRINSIAPRKPARRATPRMTRDTPPNLPRLTIQTHRYDTLRFRRKGYFIGEYDLAWRNDERVFPGYG